MVGKGEYLRQWLADINISIIFMYECGSSQEKTEYPIGEDVSIHKIKSRSYRILCTCLIDSNPSTVYVEIHCQSAGRPDASSAPKGWDLAESPSPVPF